MLVQFSGDSLPELPKKPISGRKNMAATGSPPPLQAAFNDRVEKQLDLTRVMGDLQRGQVH